MSSLIPVGYFAALPVCCESPPQPKAKTTAASKNIHAARRFVAATNSGPLVPSFIIARKPFEIGFDRSEMVIITIDPPSVNSYS